MDPSDTVLAYEQSGLDEPLGQNPLVALTSSMDHVQQLEIIYREFPSKRCNLVKRQLIDFNQLALCSLPRFQGNYKISHVIFGPVCCWWKGELCEARITEWMDNKENLCAANGTIVELFFLLPPTIWIRGWQWKVHNSSSKSCAPLKDAGPNQNASDRGATLVFLNVCPDFGVPISLLLNTRASCCNVSDPKAWISAKKTDSSRYECQLYPTAETCSWHFAIVIKIYLRIFFGETVTALYALQRFICCAFVCFFAYFHHCEHVQFTFANCKGLCVDANSCWFFFF